MLLFLFRITCQWKQKEQILFSLSPFHCDALSWRLMPTAKQVDSQWWHSFKNVILHSKIALNFFWMISLIPKQWVIWKTEMHFSYLISRNKRDSEMPELLHTQGLSEYFNTQLRHSLSFNIFRRSFWQTRSFWFEI